jgi:hypothetical protein
MSEDDKRWIVRALLLTVSIITYAMAGENYKMQRQIDELTESWKED